MRFKERDYTARRVKHIVHHIISLPPPVFQRDPFGPWLEQLLHHILLSVHAVRKP